MKTVILRAALRSALAAALLTATLPAAADSAQLQVFRAQLQQAEQLGMTDLANSLRDMIATLEEEEAASAAAGEAPAAAAVRASYFAEIGRGDLESCTYANDPQFDTICSAAMLRYNDYLAAAGTNAAADVQAEAWRRHEATAQVYVQGIGLDGHGVRPGDPTLREGAYVPPAAAPAVGTAAAEAGERPEPCPEGRSCASRQ